MFSITKRLKGTVKRLAFLMLAVLYVQTSFAIPARAQTGDALPVKELNFVFLHGAGGHPGSMQLLADKIMEQIPSYIATYEHNNPGIKVQVNTLQRFYPNNVSIETWAENVADTIKQRFSDKKNLIIIGHSMGGKTALYLTANNVGGLTEKIAMVVTINSPIKSLNRYYPTGGVSLSEYLRVRWLFRVPDEGVIDSVANYDSSRDGMWVSQNKHWLAFISGETSPLSKQFDTSGVDPLPRDMDDGIIPLSAQYSDGADVVYYGERGHSDFTNLDETAEFISERILHYIFGGPIEYSVLVRGANFERKADWLPGTDYWEDIIGEIPVSVGSLRHTNKSFTKSQEWEDTVGRYLPEDIRSSYRLKRMGWLPFFSSISQSYWVSPDIPEDGRLYLRTRAAPRSSVQVDWIIYRQGLLPLGVKRDHYEVEIISGTPFARIKDVSWLTDKADDVRLRVFSETESPFRWFKAQWRVYSKEVRQRKIIDEID